MRDHNFKLKILLSHLKTESKKTEQREDSNYCPSSISFWKLADLFNVYIQNKPEGCAAAHQYVLQQA